jgi:hypothetical protein
VERLFWFKEHGCFRRAALAFGSLKMRNVSAGVKISRWKKEREEEKGNSYV